MAVPARKQTLLYLVASIKGRAQIRCITAAAIDAQALPLTEVQRGRRRASVRLEAWVTCEAVYEYALDLVVYYGIFKAVNCITYSVLGTCIVMQLQPWHYILSSMGKS